ncbi:pyridoxamine 5'-phosphate oxidase [Pseudoxanthomonas winnipegensis]|uniref:Pyridoxine/pyridoxamine 5'-phosphate oxidase n=1 Tax=Pseudoxanthomonas winnipegensis TaxID=2480810 RepID=A0A4Q8M1P3_9GAMM|nr:pyridoxamine 5'-phosphate oxidase [Pseudoxanthomonas winnipegensis]TAA39636.1 pyridoxamine 5'-phosphate oxidase [Pseudoxanthomonas winnipegensis]
MSEVQVDLYAEALNTFSVLYEEARQSGTEPEYNAMSVATATLDGHPSLRTVLLKAHDARGLVFYSHLDSQKGRELQANPRAALLLLWRTLREAGIQVRIEGAVQLVTDAEADAYFATRPRESQLGAWASAQSHTLKDAAEFHDRLAQVEAEFDGGPVPRPDGWTGFRVVPDSFEFWYGARFRLHERWRYERAPDGHWSKRMLFP